LHSVGIGATHIDTQLPPEHSMPVAQALPQVPQWAGCDRSVSQPFAGLPSQSAQPVLHDATVQLPPLQPAVAWGRLHVVPQVPQLVGSVAVLTSQPFDARWSQSA
jgi:hypothetical protein